MPGPPVTQTAMRIAVPPHIRQLRPYVAGKPIEELARERGLTRVVKLASNENPLGCSPRALAAVRATLEAASRYVDPAAWDLVHALAAHHEIRPDQVVCGAGTDSLLAYILMAYTDTDDEIVTAEGTFIGLYVNAAKLGRRVVRVPLREYRFDLEALLAAVGPRTRIVYIANPNNPTGTMVGYEELERFVARVPEGVLVIIDEAYYHYAASSADYPQRLVWDTGNVIVTRTFSKDYGLAGLRVGFAFGPTELIRPLWKVKLPFEPSFPAQQAAIAALTDNAFLKQTLELNARMMVQMAKGFSDAGIPFTGGAANFHLLLLPDEAFAVAFTRACLDRGLILRHVAPFGIPNGVRINTGTEEETRFALEVITEVYAELQKRFP